MAVKNVVRLADQTSATGFKNKIINGGFDINQRAGSPYTIPASYGSFPYTVDRWQAYRGGTGGTYTVSTVPSTHGEIPNNEFRQFVRYQSTIAQTGTADVQFRQAIEDVRSVSNGTFVLSFWAKAASTTNIGVFYEQNFGTGGSSAVTGSNTVISIGTTWARYSVVWTPASISGKTISATDSKFYVYFTPPTLSTFTLDIWGVQLERGTVATPFENRPIGLELSLCQRYFIRLVDPSGTGVSNGGTANGATRVTVNLPVEMRIVPTSLTASGTFNFWDGTTAPTGTLSSTSYFFPSKTSIEVEFNLSSAITAGKAVKMYTSNSTSKWLDVNAEI